MPYQDIPLANDRLSASQADIRVNFQEIQNVLTVDHVDFADPNEGKHKKVTFPEQVADPVTAANEMAVYTKDVGGASALFLRKEGSGTVVDFTTATLAAQGTCTLPCGLIMKWGTGTINSGSLTSGAITYITAFPTHVYSVQVNAYGSMGSYDARDFVLNILNAGIANFYVTREGGHLGATANFYYTALGD